MSPPTPQGARCETGGVRFALFSEHAEEVELCLFDSAEAPTESRRLPLDRGAAGIWELFVPHCGPGQLYGYRVHGPFAPERGHRFNPAKLLVDPFARALAGSLDWRPEIHGDREQRGDTLAGGVDSAPFVPRSVVVDDRFDWRNDRRPATPWDETVIYECHVRGTTRRLEGLPAELRGTYLGLAAEPVIEHLLGLGVTAVELMPVQHFASEGHLRSLGLTNYWGYSPLAFFAPHAAYAGGDRGRQVTEFQEMVRRFHAAGLEVLLDVVFNHTVEGDHRGPTLSLRGVDNRVYYRSSDSDPRFTFDLTGCGNTLDITHPQVLHLVVECLRHWAGTLRVDGFRFDLAPVLGRGKIDFDPDAPFFRRLREDPLLSRLKLIAEPWDLGPGGYRLGGFPSGWGEWNDAFRDAARGFWRGDSEWGPRLARRVAGSPDLFSAGSRVSVNYVTSHDGFTLADVVSYRSKRNWDNGEGNRDGHEHNLSSNWGVEGPTDSPAIQELRSRAQRNLLATLALSHGVPMLGHGDEIGRTQLGNNNAYCHDSELTWLDWRLDDRRRRLLEFTRRLFALRRDLGLFRPSGAVAGDRPLWISIHGRPMAEADWHLNEGLPFGALFAAPDGRLLVLFNGDRRGRVVQLPEIPRSERWWLLVDTAHPGEPRQVTSAVRVAPHSLLALGSGGRAGSAAGASIRSSR